LVLTWRLLGLLNVRRMKRKEFIDALRGYAILGVICVHVAGAVPPFPAASIQPFNHGARGVQLFYVVSALTLMMSWHKRADGAAAFFIRRIFRIAPMFWLAIPAFALFAGEGPGYFAPAAVSFQNIAGTAFFLHAVYPEGSASAVPGAWTIETEMAFYLLFPAICAVIRSWRTAVAVLAVSIYVATYMWAPLQFFVPRIASGENLPVWVFFSLPIQTPVFLSGIATFYALKDFSNLINQRAATIGLLLTIGLMLLLPILDNPIPIHIGYGLLFGCLAFCLGCGAAARSLVNAPIRMLGKISYSAYLWHFFVIDCFYIARDNGFGIAAYAPIAFSLELGAVLVITSGLSYVTYRLVELPMIDVGSRLISRFQRHKSAPAVVSEPPVVSWGA
jgi:peptidoglycan/LPS O-acetylase OafA/YrhL